jgi:hypothetical protein
METRPLGEWVAEWAAEHGVPAEQVEAQARQHLEDLAALDGHAPGEIHTWRLTESAARRLLDGLEISRRRASD